MNTMASQITGVSIVCSAVCSGTDQRKHKSSASLAFVRGSSASLAFVRGIHWWPVDSPHKGPVTRKMFLFDDVIMTERCCDIYRWSNDQGHFPYAQCTANWATNNNILGEMEMFPAAWINEDLRRAWISNHITQWTAWYMQQNMMSSHHGNGFRVTGPWWGNPLVINGFPHKLPEM